jgi:hypothetical protein
MTFYKIFIHNLELAQKMFDSYIIPYVPVYISSMITKLFLHNEILYTIHLKRLTNIHITFGEIRYYNYYEHEQLLRYHKNNKKIYSIVVGINGSLIKYASDNILNDRDICIKAIHNDISAFNYISNKLKNDCEFLYDIIDLNPRWIFRHLTENTMWQVQNNDKVMIRAMLFDKTCIFMCSPMIQNMYYLQGYVSMDYNYEQIKKKLWCENGIGKELKKIVCHPDNVPNLKKMQNNIKKIEK